MTLIIVLVIREDDFLALFCLFLAPIVGALGADKDKVHSILGRVHESDGLVVSTPFAVHIFAPGKSRVFHTLLVNVEEELRGLSGGSLTNPALSPSRWLTRPENTMVSLVIGLSSLVVTTNPAVIEQPPNIIVSVPFTVFLWLQHVVTLLAEAHTSKSCHPLCFVSLMDYYIITIIKILF